MKTLILTVLLLLKCFTSNSQSLEKLDSVSAYNLYVATNKKQVLTKYETQGEPTYILFYGNGNTRNLNGYEFVVFNNKIELITFLNMVQRSIIKSNIVIHKVEKNKIRIEGVTGQTASLNIGKHNFYLNKSSINDILNQLK
jgi:hypothetical protein